MLTVEIAELTERLSEHLQAIAHGALSGVIVTDRGRPIARILPIKSEAPRLAIVPPKVPFSEVRDLRFKPAGWPISSLELLLEDRSR